MSAIRWLLVAITVGFTLVNVTLSIASLVLWDVGDSGMSVYWPNPTVRAVEAGHPAERAGIRPGDRIDLTGMSLHDRLAAINYQPPLIGQPVRLTLERNGVDHTYTLRYVPLENRSRRTAITLLGLLTSVLIAALAVYVLVRSPSIDAFALWGLAFGYVIPGASIMGYRTPDWWCALYGGVLTDVFSGVYCTAMVVLALRATGRWTQRQNYERGAVAFGIAAYLMLQYADLLILVAGRFPPSSWSTLGLAPFVGAAVLAGIVVAVALFRTRGPSRVRLRWIAIGFGCLLADALLILVQQHFPSMDYVLWPNFVWIALLNAGFGTLAYAIVRRDLFDVGFVVNRAAIYTTLTAILVGAFAGMNWAIGMLLKQTGLALPIDVILAAAVGLSLNVIQRRVDRNVDRIFFRHRYEAEQRLRRIARALVHISEDEAVVQAMVAEPVEALSLHAAALFRLTEGGVYELVSARGWPEGSPSAVTATDLLLLHLSGVTDSLRLDSVPHDAAFPHGLPRPRIAFPMWSRRELIAFVLYSSHQNGATLDPDEVETIERLAVAATTALERVAALRLQRTVVTIHDQFTALKAEFATVCAQRDEFLSMLTGSRAPQRAIASDSS